MEVPGHVSTQQSSSSPPGLEAVPPDLGPKSLLTTFHTYPCCPPLPSEAYITTYTSLFWNQK